MALRAELMQGKCMTSRKIRDIPDDVMRADSIATNRVLIDDLTAKRRRTGLTTEDVLSALDAARKRQPMIAPEA